MTHWAVGYIGTPWVAGNTDCWSFARGIWLARWGWDVPPLAINPQDARAARHALSQPHGDAGWREVPDALEGDAVLMAKGVRPCHVGIWIAPEPQAGVLHSVERAGVVFSAPGRLADLGYRIVGLYRRDA